MRALRWYDPFLIGGGALGWLISTGCGGGGSSPPDCQANHWAMVAVQDTGVQVDTVLIDGSPVGTVQPAGLLQVKVSPGSHTLEVDHASDGSVACGPMATEALAECVQESFTCDK